MAHEQGGREKRAVRTLNRGLEKRDKEEVELANEKEPRSKALHDGSPCMVVVDEGSVGLLCTCERVRKQEFRVHVACGT